MKLRDAARVIRSKNAGPLAVTLDIMFETRAAYDHATQRLAATAIAEAYGVPLADIELMHVPNAQAIKITIPRPTVAGSPGDRDVYGAQQHLPLLDLEL